MIQKYPKQNRKLSLALGAAALAVLPPIAPTWTWGGHCRSEPSEIIFQTEKKETCCRHAATIQPWADVCGYTNPEAIALNSLSPPEAVLHVLGQVSGFLLTFTETQGGAIFY